MKKNSKSVNILPSFWQEGWFSHSPVHRAMSC